MEPNVKILGSDISHMPLLSVWQHSGVTQRYGFDLTVHVTNAHLPGRRCHSGRQSRGHRGHLTEVQS